MRVVATLALLATVVMCLALLVSCGLAWQPSALTLALCPVLFLIATYVVVALIRSRTDSKNDATRVRARVARRSAFACAAIASGTLLLLAFDVPIRVAFAVWRADFDRAADRYDPEDPWDLVGEYVGPYRIDGAAPHERGGLYLRIHEAQGILETYSYGFARDANAEGTPFGSAGYDPVDLGSRWSWFAVNDDW